MPIFLIHAWDGFNTFMHSLPFITQGISLNEGLWLHLLGAAILSKLLRHYFTPWQTVLIFFTIAITWEIIEYFLEASTTQAMLAVYSTKGRYIYNTTADIVLATLMSWIVSFPSRQQ